MFFTGIGDLRATAARALVCGILAGTLTACEAGDSQSANEERATTSSDTSNVAPPNFGKWEVTKSTDPISDEIDVSIVLTAEDSGVVFGVLCNERSSAVAAIWQDYLSGEKIGAEKYQPIVYRVGNAQPSSDMWEILADPKITRTTMPREFVNEVRASNRLVLETQPYKEMPKTAVFDTTGLTEVLKANSPECDWFLNGDGKPGGAASK
ncbi:hypothetical protein [Shinella zoogloeoides]|uniref:hypothetical protein n=1 Tax=Shinella zoogloeoides TaxID=352475 RepID=UPI00273F9F17|nr:hypothetical protein [Shinella zoogloeoides]WLR93881.1 hypothetical protein Q9316_06755 [Shinella zoogloeoides]